MKKTTIGLAEAVIIHGNKKHKKVTARIDTGATKGSIDVKIAAEVGLGPVIRTKLVKSASGFSVRANGQGKYRACRKKSKGILHYCR